MVGMIVLRYLYILALVAWLGGMLVLLGLGVPSIAAVVQQHDASAGRALTDAIVSDLFARFHLVVYLCALMMLAMLVAMRLLGPKPAQVSLRIAIVFAMLVIAFYSGWPQGVGVAGSSVFTHTVRQLSFGRLQDLPTTAMAINIVGGLSLLYWEAKE